MSERTVPDGELPSSARDGKLAARLALAIEQDIASAGWPIGHLIGSESELRQRYRVSRQVLREAIRLVEHHQVASMRRGPQGGLVVSAPDAAAATSAVLMYLEFADTTLEHVLAVRMTLEPIASALAAEHITEAGIAELRDALADEQADGLHAYAPGRLHLVLARLCGNPVLELLIQVLWGLTVRYAGDRAGPSGFPAGPPGRTHHLHRAHREIVAAVVAGEGGPAQLRTAEHLVETWDILTDRRASPRPLTDEAEDPGAGQSGEPGEPGDVKLAEIVAHQIIAEIRAGDRRPGTVIGSEAALLERLGVSRSALREAVRVLEYHSIAHMRRGPGGGLITGRPDPTASIQAVARHLRFRGVDPEHLCTLRDALELETVNQVAARAHREDVAARLRADLRTDADPDRPEPLAGDEAGHGGCDRWHLELARLSDNPVLSLFLRILVALRVEHHATRGGRRATDHAHHGIATALLGDDGALARHRMRRHLRRIEPPEVSAAGGGA